MLNKLKSTPNEYKLKEKFMRVQLFDPNTKRLYGYDGDRYVCYFYYFYYFYCSGWNHISLGIHFSVAPYNIEIHLPFGFIRIGEVRFHTSKEALEIGGKR